MIILTIIKIIIIIGEVVIIFIIIKRRAASQPALAVERSVRIFCGFEIAPFAPLCLVYVYFIAKTKCNQIV